MLATVVQAQDDRWDIIAELLAALIEVADRGNRMFHAVHMQGKVPKPIVINRPGANDKSSQEAEADQPKLTRAAMRAILLGG